jgi:hypothetical protein
VRQWADVYVPAPDARVQLEKKALFFIPSAVERCDARDLTVAQLGSISSTASIRGPRAGRNAISKLFRFHPVTYDSAIGFINVANIALGGAAPAFTTSDIIACVFRLRHPMDLLNALRLTPEQVAAEAGLSRDVGIAAVQRYRIQLNDALAIWQFLKTRSRDEGSPPRVVSDAITDDAHDFITADVRAGLPMAVKALNDFEYVYRWDNLKPAPPSGHYWALEDEPAA